MEQTGLFHRPWIYHSLGSTNTHLATRAMAGAPPGEVVAAERQWAGKGRRGRGWFGARGASVAMSVWLRPDLDGTWMPFVGICLAMASVDAVAELSELRLGLKWPNDLLWDNKKVGGVLAELIGATPGARAGVVVGVGLNLAGPLPEELSGIASDLASITGVRLDHDEVVASILWHLGSRLRRMEDSASRQSQLQEYEQRCVSLGQAVRVQLEGREVVGVATGIAAGGGLVLRHPDAHQSVIWSGDVVHLRPEEPE